MARKMVSLSVVYFVAHFQVKVRTRIGQLWHVQLKVGRVGLRHYTVGNVELGCAAVRKYTWIGGTLLF